MDARRATLEEFARVESRDPAWSAVHLAAACAWCATLAIGKAPEAVAFGALALVAVVRLPSTWRLYPALLRSPPMLALAAFYAWQALAICWSSVPDPEYGALLPRGLLLPLLLWPMAHRWALLLGAFAAGTAAHSAILLARSWNGAGFQQYNDSRPLISHLASAGLVFACATIACWSGALLARTRATLALAAGAGMLCVAGLGVLSVRASLAAFLVGTVAATVVALRPRATRRRVAIAATVCAVAVAAALAVAVVRSSRFEVWMRSLERSGQAAGQSREQAAQAERERVEQERAAQLDARLRSLGMPPKGDPIRGASDRERLEQAMRKQPADASFAFVASSGRSPVWLAAIEIWREHPIAGAGSQSWKTECRPRLERDPDRYGIPISAREWVPKLPGAHSAYLQELAERGVVGLALLLLLLWTTGVRLWRGGGAWDAAGAFGIFAAWSAAALAQSQSIQGLAMLLLALLLVRACAFGAARRATRAAGR
ncbi:MAG: O-antigen ligase family protein [Phycisphaerales bacterium]